MDALERGRLAKATLQLAREWAPITTGRTELADLMAHETWEMDDEDYRSIRLATLTALKTLGDYAEMLAELEVSSALVRGTTFEQLGAAWGVGEAAARKRWRHLVREGNRVAVVISRRDRVHHDLQDERGSYGEVGGAEQYDADRGSWLVGAEVRKTAEYAIIAVDGVVRRIYSIDDWEQDGAKWKFIGDLWPAEEVDLAYEAGSLPMRLGDSCPTRRGGAYRPVYF